jgi:predicted PurR-regulated permease PerM
MILEPEDGVSVRSSTSSDSRVALWILAVVALLFLFRAAKALFIPVVIAGLISYALAPVVNWLEKHRVPPLAGAALVLLTILGTAVVGGYTVRDDARRLIDTLPQTIDQVRQRVSDQLGSTSTVIERAAGGGQSDPRREKAGSGGDPGGSGTMPGSLVERGVGAIFSLAGHTVVVFFLIYFLLISSHHIRDRLVEISGPDADGRRTTAAIINDINRQIQRYLLVLLVTGVIVGVSTWLVLAWMGVEQAPIWGLLAGIFNSIPYFGPVIVSGGLFMVGLVQDGTTQALQMSGAAILITSLEGWLLTPALMGKAERMSPLVVFLGVLLWTWVWGAWGTVLAVPMLVVIKSIADRVERFRPLGRLLAP